MDDLRFQVLGPVTVTRGGVPVPLGGARRRSLLALLISGHGRVVPTSTVIDAVWEESALADPASSVQVLVSTLRRLLNEPGDRPDQVIKTVASGYALSAPESACDSWRFSRARRAGRESAERGDYREASRRYAEALDEWSGIAYQDLRGLRFADELAAGLEEQRLTTVEAKLEADLARGAHGDVVDEAGPLTSAHPLREGLHTTLMLAFYRCGRQGDALSVYARLREALLNELGVEPGTAARSLQSAILRQDPSLDFADVDAPARVSDRVHRTSTHVVGARDGEARLVDSAGAAVVLRGRLSIGREPGNDLVMADVRVSRRHAVVQRTPQGWLLVDQQSSNGTLVNGNLVATRVLRHGDVITVGGARLTFLNHP